MSAGSSLPALSIAARSFLLVFAALVIAAILALVLVLNRPPLRNAPVSLNEIAQLLRLPGEQAPRRGASGSEGEGMPGPPPDDGRAPGPGPQFGDGAGPGPWPVPGEPPPRPRERELRVEVQRERPVAPGDVDQAVSASAVSTLARLLSVVDTDVVVHVPRQAVLPGTRDTYAPASLRLGQGFIAARRMENGSWRTVTSVIEGFPNAFQRQALLLGLLGLALLLPLAWLFARALAAPLQRFAAGAQRLGRDPAAPPLPAEGPREMRLAVEAFNTMQGRVNRLLQERTQMVAAIAHDLRTPLTRLAFRLEGLPAPLGDKVGADIQEMKAMISAALDFIRDRAVTGERERLDLRLLLERIVEDQGDLGHDITLAEGPPVIVEGVPLALRRLVMNLVENALKYGQRARLRLAIVQRNALIEIDDDGPGIPESRHQQVFEPFFRLEASRNRDTGGIGLGLATVRAIVLDHGGDIALGNRGGGGLRVTVTLPLP